MIILKDVKKIYGEKIVLDIPYYNFKKEKSYLLIGCNGSGKSTLIKCILGINSLTTGTIFVSNTNIGYIPERVISPDFLTLEDFLKNICKLYNCSFNNDLVNNYYELFSISGNIKMSKMSKGMLQKAMIIQTLIHDAELFIFDEPLNGLDKKSQFIFFDILNDLKQNKKTIIVTTHYPQFYTSNFDYVITLENGTINDANT